MQDMHILSTDQGQVFAAVQEWNQNDTYNLYISDPHGVYFTLALENVKTTRGPGDNSMIDLYEVGTGLYSFDICVFLTKSKLQVLGLGKDKDLR